MGERLAFLIAVCLPLLGISSGTEGWVRTGHLQILTPTP